MYAVLDRLIANEWSWPILEGLIVSGLIWRTMFDVNGEPIPDSIDPVDKLRGHPRFVEFALWSKDRMQVDP